MAIGQVNLQGRLTLVKLLVHDRWRWRNVKTGTNLNILIPIIIEWKRKENQKSGRTYSGSEPCHTPPPYLPLSVHHICTVQYTGGKWANFTLNKPKLFLTNVSSNSNWLVLDYSKICCFPCLWDSKAFLNYSQQMITLTKYYSKYIDCMNTMENILDNPDYLSWDLRQQIW